MKLNRRSLRRLIESVINEEEKTNKSTLSDTKTKCVSLFGNLMTAAAMKKLKPDYIEARDEIIGLKEKSEVKEVLKDFDKKLAGAYYFGKIAAPDDKIKEKFGMTGKEAEEKIKSMLSDCKNL